MKAEDLRYHFQEIGTWVNWFRTCDQFMHGDPEMEVKGIATGWIATDKAIREAGKKGLNLFVSHEQLWVEQYRGTVSGDRVNRQKRDLLDDLGMTVMRCHDTWDRFPEYGIPDAWASWLGFETEPRKEGSFYKVCLLGERPFVPSVE